jgi:hypothetical protein
MSINKLVKEVEKQIKLAEEAANKASRAAIFMVGNNIITRTPVGNDVFWQSKAPKGYSGGQLRGNWQSSIGSPAQSVLSTKQNGATGAATSSLASGVASFDLDDEKTMYLANNMPYAERINNGYSVQPGVGVKWVDKEVMRFDSILNQIVQKANK